MIVVDGQIHIWGPSTPEHPWIADGWTRHRPTALEADEILAEMDGAGVAGAILVPPSWDSRGNDIGIEAARLHPGRLAVMGRLYSMQPQQAALFPDWKSQPGMLGLRFSFTHAASAFLVDGTADWIWPAAERAGLPVMVLCPKFLPQIGDIAERHPGLKFIVDHFNISSTHQKGDAAFGEIPELIKLSRHPNIAVKASSLPAVSAQAYPFRDLHKYVRQVYDAYGPRRVFWGSDISRSVCTYRQHISFFTEEMPWLSDEDKTWIMGRGLCEWLGWSPVAA